MELDYTARRNLELTVSLHGGEKKGSLLWVLDKTRTAMGARMLRQWLEKPLLSVAHITRRQNAVETFVNEFILREQIEKLLGGVNDMERIASRIVYGSANGRDLRSLYQVCSRLPQLRDSLQGLETPLLRQLYEGMDTLEDIGITESEEKTILRGLISSAANVIYLNSYFEQMRRERLE